jgi:hypothetical protein
MAVGLVLAPTTASAAPVEPPVIDSVPVDSVPVDSVPVDSVPLPEGCANYEDVVVCVGEPPLPPEYLPFEPVPGEPVPFEPVPGAPGELLPEAVSAPVRAAVVPVAPVVPPMVQDAAPQVASEAPVPAVAPATPAAGITLGHVVPRSVADATPVAPAVGLGSGTDGFPMPTWGVGLLLGMAVALAGAAGFRRARIRP